MLEAIERYVKAYPLDKEWNKNLILLLKGISRGFDIKEDIIFDMFHRRLNCQLKFAEKQWRSVKCNVEYKLSQFVYEVNTSNFSYELFKAAAFFLDEEKGCIEYWLSLIIRQNHFYRTSSCQWYWYQPQQKKFAIDENAEIVRHFILDSFFVALRENDNSNVHQKILSIAEKNELPPLLKLFSNQVNCVALSFC